MNIEEAIKRLRQETCAATYMPDFDKELCLRTIEQYIPKIKYYEVFIRQYSFIYNDTVVYKSI